MITASVTDQLIELQPLIDSVKTNQAGALAIFSGDVRDNDGGKGVKSLNYEVHPSAQKVIQEITTRVVAKYDVINAAVVHRYGAIPIGESAFTVVVSAVHRAPAMAACDEIVSIVKTELPIWKFQVFVDGTSEWVNSA